MEMDNMLNFLKATAATILPTGDSMSWEPGAGEMMIKLNRRNRMVKVSQNVPDILGRSRKSLKDLSIYRLLSGEDQDRLAEMLNYVRRSKRPSGGRRQSVVRRIELTFHSSEGVLLHYTARVQAHNDGTISMLLHEAPSASGSETPDQVMNASKDENIAKAKVGVMAFDSSRLADLSHEMKTPLNAILGFSDAMRERTFGSLGDPRYQDYVDHIYTSGEHLMGLVTSVLDLAKIDAGQYQVKPILGNFSDISVECAEMIRPQMDEAGLKLEICAEQVDDSLLDVQAVRQIMINLLSNAVKFTSDGGIKVQVKRKNDDQLELVVEDSGIGMSQEQLARLGKRYTDVSGAGVRGAGGTGLGLALASSLAELHGGSLSLISEPGEGVTATLILPFLLVRKRSAGTIDTDYRDLANPALGPRDIVMEESNLQAGRTEALQTQMERIDDYRRKLNEERDASAA